MKNLSPKNRKLLHLFTRHPFAIGSVALVSSISLLSSNWVFAQTDALVDSVSVPATPAPAPAPAPRAAAPAPAPAPAPRAAAPAPAPAPAPRAAAPAPAPRAAAPEPAPQPEFSAPSKLSAPQVNVPTSEAPAKIPERLIDRPAAQPTGVRPQIQIIDKGTSNFADNLGAPSSGDRVPVQITDRATGCQTLNGQASANCGRTTTTKPAASKPSIAVTASPIQQRHQLQAQRKAIATSNSRQVVPVQTAVNTGNRQPSNVQAIPAEQLAFYQNAQRQGTLPGNTALMFPLSIPVNISSAFGWRIHPILGTRRLHSGTDLSAPMGTPVLAAYSGQVAVASNVGGYGLMVALRHEDNQQESRYAHLSEIFVEVGQEVEQGQVIGLVGSTGLSTGPHLHFEWRHLMPSGWVAVDAGMHLEAAMQNLIAAMEQTEVGELLEPHEELQLSFELEPRPETVATTPKAD
jgi:murein DD-endopeptidase MepM/ murein hydrolase activator NlpD